MSANDVRGDYVTYPALINACAKQSDAFGAMKWLQRIVDLWQQSHVPLLQHGITWVAEIGRGPVRHGETMGDQLLQLGYPGHRCCGCRLGLVVLDAIPTDRKSDPVTIKGIFAKCPRPETVREITGDAFKCLEEVAM